MKLLMQLLNFFSMSFPQRNVLEYFCSKTIYAFKLEE